MSGLLRLCYALGVVLIVVKALIFGDADWTVIPVAVFAFWLTAWLL